MSKKVFWCTLFLVTSLWLVIGLAIPAQAATSQISAATLPYHVRQAQPPTAQSILIVLLDRSGSLDKTDKPEYSASIAKVFADLWPGKMAVIFFSGDHGPLLQTQLYDFSQPGTRDALKQQIEQQRYQVSGDTPTQIAIEQAETVLAQHNYPAGSRVVLITDGQPDIADDTDGTRQIQAIEQKDAPVFAAHNVPISTFGLGNDISNSGQAKAFLQQVASETGGAFADVQNPAQLAKPVLQMYASWQNLTFVPASGNNTFHIDTYAKKVDFIAFTQNSTTYRVTLQNAGGQNIPDQAFQASSQDLHYVFESLVISQFNPSGNYTIHSDDSQVQAYALEQTRLQVEIVAPTPQTVVYTQHDLTIVAALYDGNPQQHIFPHTGDAVAIGITFTVTAHGQTVDRGEETLTQEASPHTDLFSVSIRPSTTGALTITVSATYQFIPVPNHPSITLPVTIAPPPPCALTNVQCVIQQYGIGLGASLLALVLLLLIGWWYTRPAPFGFLVNPDPNSLPRVLGRNRTLGRSLWHKSLLFSDELRGFDWAGASFALRFKRNRRVYFVSRHKTLSQEIGNSLRPENQPAVPGKEIFLRNGDQIIVNGQTRATFYESRARAEQADQAWL